MHTRLARAAGILLAVVLSAGIAQAQVDPTTSFAAMTAPGCFMVCPAVDGNTLASVGASIRVQVFDVTGLPMAGLPFNAFEVDGMPPGNFADGFNPPTTWDQPPAGFTNLGGGAYVLTGTFVAGGNTQLAMVKVLGVIIGGAPLPLTIVSPDLNGDATVNLSDVGVFAGILLGPYDWRADFNCDGVVNISDVGFMAFHIGHTYPPGFVVDPVD